MHHLDISEAIISWCVFMYLRRKLWFSVLHYVTQCLAVNHPLTTDGWRRNQQGSDSCLYMEVNSECAKEQEALPPLALLTVISHSGRNPSSQTFSG